MAIGHLQHKYKKRTPEQLIDELAGRPDPIHAVNQAAMTRYMKQFTKAERKEVREIAKARYWNLRHQLDFYAALRKQVGHPRRSWKRGTVDARRRKRLSRLPYRMDASSRASWKFVDATRGILLPGNRMLIPSIQKLGLGRIFVDIRIYSYLEGEEKLRVRPTRKGVCFSIDKLDELRGLLEALGVRWKRLRKIEQPQEEKDV